MRLTPGLFLGLLLFLHAVAGCTLAQQMALEAVPLGASAEPTATAQPDIPATATPPPATTAAPAAAPELPALVPPAGTVELVFEHHELKRKLSVYAPPGAAAVPGDLGRELINVGDKTIFVVGAGEDLTRLLKRDIAAREASGTGKLIEGDDHGALWSEKDGKETGYLVMWNIETGGGKRHACYTLRAQKRQAEAESVLAMCRTLRDRP